MVDDGGDSNTLASVVVKIKNLLAVLTVAAKVASCWAMATCSLPRPG
jgi:hypothetical protein